MATIILSAAGAALGNAIGGGVLGVSAAVIGRAVGASLGSAIDQRWLGQGSSLVETGQVDSFRLHGASEGASVPRVLGQMRIPGQLIWSSRFRETVTQSTSGGGKGTSKPKVTEKRFTYSVSLAFALGEGKIRRVGRIWADGKRIAKGDLNLTVYRGSEDQTPDSVISAIEGLENTPSFYGTAYAVIEDLQLEGFGNRIPQFTFEVLRPAQSEHPSISDPADDIRSVCMIPGTGEYSLATSEVYYQGLLAENSTANVNTDRGQTDFVHSLRDLKSDLPYCDSVSLVVSWFGSDLRCAQCDLQPKVEQKDREGVPLAWSVNGVSRIAAATVSQKDGRPIFGGTPDDTSVLEAIGKIKECEQSVVFYPFILMDIQQDNGLPDPWSVEPNQPIMPWRGRITLSEAPGRMGTPDQTVLATNEVAAFFGNAQVSDFSIQGANVSYSGPEEWSYRRFILHYAHLCAVAGGIDAFCIGSEMRSLTQIRNELNQFPAVTALQLLAQDVSAILGPGVKIGYAADWSEYFGFQPQDGTGDVYFHLDPLWGDAHIDFIGIDNYMPLSDWQDVAGHLDEGYGSVYAVDYLAGNIAGGEGFDWYYPNLLDRNAQNRIAITDGAHNEPWVFRYKDIHSWWWFRHYNRIGGIRQVSNTEWLPQSKPIWFTEFGCPAVDKGTNQPNVFIDPKSSESAAPYHSNGASDPFMQVQYLRAIYKYWNDAAHNPQSEVYYAPMVDMARASVWAWDARPWPDFPLRTNLWSDGDNFARGHWISGRFAEQSLATVVAEICETAGFSDFDVSRLYGSVRGYLIQNVETPRQSLQVLMLAFGFTSFERDGKLGSGLID